MYIKVKVMVGAKKEKIVKKSENSFDIFVKEPAEKFRSLAKINCLDSASDVPKIYFFRVNRM